MEDKNKIKADENVGVWNDDLFYECSRCGKTLYFCVLNAYDKIRLPTECPACKAKMVGVKRNGDIIMFGNNNDETDS